MNSRGEKIGAVDRFLYCVQEAYNTKSRPKILDKNILLANRQICVVEALRTGLKR